MFHVIEFPHKYNKNRILLDLDTKVILRINIIVLICYTLFILTLLDIFLIYHNLIIHSVPVTHPDSILKQELHGNYLFILDLPRLTTLAATLVVKRAGVGGLSKQFPVAAQ